MISRSAAATRQCHTAGGGASDAILFALLWALWAVWRWAAGVRQRAARKRVQRRAALPSLASATFVAAASPSAKVKRCSASASQSVTVKRHSDNETVFFSDIQKSACTAAVCAAQPRQRHVYG